MRIFSALASFLLKSLSGRILLALMLMLLAGLSLLALYMQQTTDELRRTLAYVEAKRIVKGITVDSDMSQLPLQIDDHELAYTLYRNNGQVLWYSANISKPRPWRPKVLMGNAWHALRLYSGRILDVPVAIDESHTMMVMMNDEQQRQILSSFVNERIRRVMWLVIPVAAVLSFVLLPLLLFWILKPIKSASMVARRILPNDHQQRIPEQYLPVEIKPLAVAANQALQRLRMAYQAEQRFVSDAAHELRTPLTVMMFHVEQLQQQGCDVKSLQNTMCQLQRLLDQLLLLARLEQNGDRAQLPQQTQLSRALREVAAAQLPLYEQSGRQLELSIPSDLESYFYPIAANHLQTILTNLLDNARIHGVGMVQMSLVKQPRELLIRIQDQGRHFDTEQALKLCQRFQKGNPDSPGSGLGLAIVCQAVQATGGELFFSNENGTTVTVSLPFAYALGD